MVIAFILKPVVLIGFFIQYYALIALVLVKNMILKSYYYIKKESVDHSWNPIDSVHPHVFAQSNILITHEGFTFQIHEALTQDNAYVTFWRIRHQNPQKWNIQNPILLQHGLLDCSMSWFLHQNKNQCLPFVLAQQGYDVWVGNNRGTIHSDRNNHLPNYWEFNIDHFAKYDQPALIEKVLKQTGKSKLIYIGHSQGTTQFILGLSQNQNLQNKIQKFIGLGALISLGNLKNHNLLSNLSKYQLVEILEKMGFKSILHLPRWMNRKVGVLIYHFSFYAKIILTLITSLCGKTEKINIDCSRLGILVSHEPGGTSIQSVIHWIQTFREGKLSKYNYGKTKNLKIYGQQIPPEYTFDHIKDLPFKSHLFRGEKDAVISDKDFENFVNYFDTDKIDVHTIKDYAHLDYAWSMNAKEDIYDNIIDILIKERQITTFSRNNSTENTNDDSCSSREDIEDIYD